MCDTNCELTSDRLRQVLHRASERLHETRYGVKTSGFISEETLGFAQGDGRLHYTPVPYAALKRLLSIVEPNPQKDVFIDWGCGRGRVLVIASMLPYREVIGVECSAALCSAAEQNLKRARVRRRCGSVKVVNADAREFPIPEDSSVMFLYNPFRGALLTEVVGHIRDSWMRNRRPITFLVSNHVDFIEDTGSADWLKPLSSWPAYPQISCAVFRSF